MEKKKYDYVGEFFDGFACVELSDKWGFINEKGEEITSIKYDSVDYFINGFAEVKLTNKYGFINEKGEEIIPCIYDWGETSTLIDYLPIIEGSNKKDVLSSLFDELFDYAWSLAQTPDEYAKLNEIKERI